MENQQKRQIAYKLRIKDILESQYQQQEGWQPNFLLTKDSQKVSRVNIIGTITSQPDPSTFILDDGTGQINVRIFEPMKNENPELGQPVLIIGRPREFNAEKYLVPEIIKKLSNPLWIEVRKKELKEEKQIITPKTEEKPETQVPYEYLINLIKKLDQGEGVDIDQITKQSFLQDTEELINNLLKEGEIFEVKPGTIKLLK